MPERTLAEIEAEARRLCGDEFEVHRARGKTCIWVESDTFEASFRPDGKSYIRIEENNPDYGMLARFIDICRNLDSYIRGEP